MKLMCILSVFAYYKGKKSGERTEFPTYKGCIVSESLILKYIVVFSIQKVKRDILVILSSDWSLKVYLAYVLSFSLGKTITNRTLRAQ